MLYTEKQVQRMIDERLRQEMMEMHNSRRFDEMHERINGLDKRICEFPATVSGVVGQAGQYSEAYLHGTDAPADCYEAAQKALDGEHTVPPEVVYQANFPQGEVWWASEVDTGWFRSTTYFCK